MIISKAYLYLRRTVKRYLTSEYRRIDTLIFWVTNRCDANCKMCFLKGRLNKDTETVLSLDEYRLILKSLGKIRSFIVSGGEPFLRSDIDDVCILVDKITKPVIISINTNGNNPEVIHGKVKNILSSIKANLTISLSLDALPQTHEMIRGVAGIYSRLTQTYDHLLDLKSKHHNLHIQILTVLFKDNYCELAEFYGLLQRRFGNASFSFELMRNPFNISDCPEPIKQDEFRDFIEFLKSHNDIHSAHNLALYDIDVKILEKRTQVMSCLAGTRSIVIDFLGNVYPCENLNFYLNLRDVAYNTKRIFRDRRWKKIVHEIRQKKCYCTNNCLLASALVAQNI